MGLVRRIADLCPGSMRARSVRTGESTSAVVLKKLDTVLPEFRFEELPFEVAIEFLSDITRVKIIVEWREVGFERDHPVSLWLRNAPLRTALRIILAEVSDPKKPCDFDVAVPRS